jgi:hypothetical protein
VVHAAVDELMTLPLELHFVLGTGRCGSTLVHEILCQHDEVAFLSNLEDLSSSATVTSAWNGRLSRRLPPWITEKGRARFAPSEGYRALAREVSPIFERSDRDLLGSDATPWLASRLTTFFERRAGRSHEPVYLHKLTGWPRAGFLHAVFPEARYANVIRDGRAVANSWLQMPWWLGYRGPEHWHFGPLSDEHRETWERHGRSYVVLAGLAWVILMEGFESAREALPERVWLDLRYEDLLADPTHEIGRLLTFLGLPFDASFRHRFARYTLRPDRADVYQHDLDPVSLKALDDVLGPTLERYGYV